MDWKLYAQLTNSTTLQLNDTDHIWLTSGTGLTDAILVGAYNDGTHIGGSDDLTHRCNSSHANNNKFVDASHLSINGASSVAFSTSVPAIGDCTFKFVLTSDSSIQTAGAKFYAYDGSLDTNPWNLGGGFFRAFEADGTITPAWVDANGSDNALVLQDQAAATTHTFYIGVSASAGSAGTKPGKVKIVLSYV